MCVQYWPAGKNREEVYSGIGVTVENEEQLANFMIRTIRMRKVYFAKKCILKNSLEEEVENVLLLKTFLHGYCCLLFN